MSGATNRTSTSGASPPHCPFTTRRKASIATLRPDGGEPRRTEHRAQHLRDLRAVRVELEHEPAVLAQEAMTRPVEAVHVALEPMAQRDPRDREPSACVVDEAGEQLALVVVDGRAGSSTSTAAEQRDAVRGARGRQVGALERDPPRRHVPAGMSDDQLGEQHQGPPDQCSVRLMLPDAAGPAHTRRRDQTRGCPTAAFPSIGASTSNGPGRRRHGPVLHLLHRRRRTGRSRRAVPGRHVHRVLRQISDAPRVLAPCAARASHRRGRSFAEGEYVELQRRVHQLGAPSRAVSRPNASTC